MKVYLCMRVLLAAEGAIRRRRRFTAYHLSTLSFLPVLFLLGFILFREMRREERKRDEEEREMRKREKSE